MSYSSSDEQPHLIVSGGIISLISPIAMVGEWFA